MSTEKTPAPAPATEKPATEVKVDVSGAADKPTVAEKLVAELDAAPADLFAKQGDTSSNPTRVNVCIAHVKAFAETVVPGQTDDEAVATATNNMSTMFGLLETLNTADVTKVLDTVMETVTGGESRNFCKAFDKAYSFIGLAAIKSSAERERFVRMMNLISTYAKLRDKSKLETRVSVSYSLDLVKNEAGRKAIHAYFSK